MTREKTAAAAIKIKTDADKCGGRRGSGTLPRRIPSSSPSVPRLPKEGDLRSVRGRSREEEAADDDDRYFIH